MTPHTTKALDTFYSHYPLKHYKKGHVFILPGETIEYAYQLVEGKVKVYDVSYRGDEIIITNRIPPAIFPMSLVVNHAPTRYIYEASTDITIRQAPTEDMRKFLDAHPPVVLELLSSLYSILDSVLERMVHYIASNAKNRLIYAIISECKEFGSLDEDNVYRIDVNEKELGSRAGLSRETVSREARALKRLKILEVHHNYMLISNFSQLERYLETHP
jgi:CRP-like cAMP-binding protein